MDIHHNKKERNIKELEVYFFVIYFQYFLKIMFFVMNNMNPYYFMIPFTTRMLHLSIIRHALQNLYPFVMTSNGWIFESKRL